MTTAADRKAIVAWCLFDWANSAFPTVVITFVFAAYFVKGVVGDEIAGTAMWGQAMGLSALVVAVLSPILGAIADRSGRRKPWLLASTVGAVVASALLWRVTPDPSSVILALLLCAGGNIAFEIGMVFYNAMLPDLVTGRRIGRVSGWGWGLGYVGGLVCLICVLYGFVEASPPPFGLDPTAAEHIRAAGPFVAIWFAIFSLPLFLLTPDRARSGMPAADAVRQGIRSLWSTLKGVRAHRNVLRFLIARMIYTDGLNTLFAFGGLYAAGTFGMSFSELIKFGIGMNVAAGLGAFAFAWIDDRAGPKRVIHASLIALTVLGAAILVVRDVELFWLIGLSLGLFIGPAQSASRSLMARLAPADMRTEMFGLYALSGKATAFLGPILVGALTAWADSQRAGMAVILLFFIIGGLLMVRVSETPEIIEA
ncbi:MAG: MFS transporter [Proteobacteria bacterium]|nr:MFS transporter [Pseudomonadota bacterium]